jgi:hypothetical protein
MLCHFILIILVPQLPNRTLLTLNGNLRREGEITNVEVVLDSSLRALMIKTSFLNKGNMLLKCKGTVEIRNEMGDPIDSFPLQGFTSLPGDKRMVTSTHPIELETGEYSSLIIIDFNGDYLLAGETFFEIPNE